MNLRAGIDGREVAIYFPQELAAGILPLLVSEQPEVEAVFGAPVRFVNEPPNDGPRWVVDHQPARENNSLVWNAASLTMTSRVRDAAGLGATIQMLHSLVSLDVDHLDDDVPDDLPAAMERIGIELERGFPGFDIRSLTFDAVRGMYPPFKDLSIDDLQRLVAELQDGHTAVREEVSVYNPPYAVEIDRGQATVLRVPAWSAAAKAGIDAGWQLELDDLHGWLARSGFAPHAHALIAGRRAIALNGIPERRFAAHGPGGERVEWTEHARPFSLDELLSVDVVAGDAVLVRLHNWIAGVGIKERFDEIIADHAHLDTMVLDLRGNTGGNLLMAKRMRRRFLREETLLGTIQFTRGDGTLADPVDIWDGPATRGNWPGKLIVLIDPLTFSASEDFLQGLQGLAHVTVIGSPSGGGSGRPRTLPIVPGWNVTISTALTFDRSGRCIEGQGIPVDIEVDPLTQDWRRHLG